jgi:hypothetical protein
MNARFFALLVCAFATSCGSGPPAQPAADVTNEAQAFDDASAQDCPFPADASNYESTTLTARAKTTPAPRLGVFDTIKKGCAVLTFTLNDGAAVSSATVLSENPAGFGAVATKILHWNNYALGASTATVFIVRVAGETLPAGGALTVLAFKDSTINLEVPP